MDLMNELRRICNTIENCHHCPLEESYICPFNDGPLTDEQLQECYRRMSKCSDEVVNHPSHYETGHFECIEVMLETQGIEAVENFCICNAFKYLYRHKNKNGTEDIKKAVWYLNKYLELEGKENG